MRVSPPSEGMSRQIGHTRRIGHKKYAVSAADHPELDSVDQILFEKCSSIWYNFVIAGWGHALIQHGTLFAQNVCPAIT